MGGQTTQTVSQNRDPWAPAQPALNTAIGGALNAFNTTYQGTGVADMNPLVTQGQNAMLANANSGQASGLANAGTGNFASVLGNNGLSQEQSGAVSGITGALGGFNDTMGKAQGYLDPYASGQYLNQPNPYFEKSLQNAMESAADATNRQFSAAGRYGSGAQSAALGKQLGNISTDAYMNEYNRQQQNQLAAIGQMGNFANTGLQGNLGAYGATSGIGQQGVANTGAIMGAIPSMVEAQNADARTLTNVGGQRMDYQQAQIDAANQNPWSNVGNLAQIAGGIGGLGGTVNGTQTTTTDPGIAGIIGGAMMGLGGLGNAATGWSRLFGS